MSRINSVNTDTVKNVTETLYHFACQMIGSENCIKCVSIDGESIFTTDVLHLLSSMEIQHPVGELILQALEAQRRNSSGCLKTLLYMITSLSKLVFQLETLNIPSDKSLKIIQASLQELSGDVLNITTPVIVDLDLIPESADIHMSESLASKAPGCTNDSSIAQLCSCFTGHDRSTRDHDCTIDKLFASSASSKNSNKINEMSLHDASCVDFTSTSKTASPPFYSHKHLLLHEQRVLKKNDVMAIDMVKMQKAFATSSDANVDSATTFTASQTSTYADNTYDLSVTKSVGTCSEYGTSSFNPPKDLPNTGQKEVKGDHLHNPTFSAIPEPSSVNETLEPYLPSFNEADPIFLRMADSSENAHDTDISWFFESHGSVRFADDQHSLPKQTDIKSTDACYHIGSDETNITCCGFKSSASGNLHNVEREHSKLTNSVDCQETFSVHVPSLTAEDGHDSDFEDCFDDTQNRKSSSVTSENIPHFHPHSYAGSFWAGHQDLLLLHNARKHFSGTNDFENNVCNSLESHISNNESDDEFEDSFPSFDVTQQVEITNASNKQRSREVEYEKSRSYEHNPTISNESHVQSISQFIIEKLPLNANPNQNTSSPTPETEERYSEENIRRSDQLANQVLSAGNSEKNDKSGPNTLLEKILAEKKVEMESKRTHQITISSRHLSEFSTSQDEIESSANAELLSMSDDCPDGGPLRIEGCSNSSNYSFRKSMSHEETKFVGGNTEFIDQTKSEVKYDVKNKEKSKNSTEQSQRLDTLLERILADKKNEQKSKRHHQIAVSSRHFAKGEGKEVQTKPNMEECVQKSKSGHGNYPINLDNCTDSSQCLCKECTSSNQTELNHGEVQASPFHGVVQSQDQKRVKENCRYINSLHYPESGIIIPKDIPLLVNQEMIEASQKLLYHQLTNGNSTHFNLKQVSCLSLSSSARNIIGDREIDWIHIMPGIVLPCTSEFLQKLSQGDNTAKRALLIQADLTHSYSHKGFKPNLQSKVLVSNAEDVSSHGDDNSWAHTVLTAIGELGIQVLLVKGKIDKKLHDLLEGAGVLTLCNLSHQTINVVAYSKAVDTVTYVTDASELHVCHIKMEPLVERWMDYIDERGDCPPQFVKIVGSEDVQTIVLSCMTKTLASLSEEKLWKTLNFLSHVIKDKKLLPGAGETEVWCAEKLEEKAAVCLDAENTLQCTVLEMLAKLFWDFHTLVVQNSCMDQKEFSEFLKTKSDRSISPSNFDDGNHNPSSDDGINLDVQTNRKAQPLIDKYVPSIDYNTAFSSCPDSKERVTSIVYDNFAAKIDVWDHACDVVSQITAIDSIVITGIDMTSTDKDFALL